MRDFVRYILGIVFLFSGTIKGLEFNTTAHTVLLYSEAFHFQITEVSNILITSVMIICEIVIGLGLITRVYINIIKWVTLLICFFFLLLTFIVAKFELIQDCGCFGSTLKLSSWSSFYKNIPLCMGAVYLCIFSRIKPYVKLEYSRKYVCIITLSVIWFSISAILLPSLIDNTFYSKGKDIRSINKNIPVFRIDGQLNSVDIDEILVNSKKKTVIGYVRDLDKKGIKYLASLVNQYNSEYNKIFVTPDMSEFGGANRSVYPLFRIDESLYDSTFLSNYGFIIIDSNLIIKKEDFNFLSLNSVGYCNFSIQGVCSQILRTIWVLTFIIPIVIWMYITYLSIKASFYNTIKTKQN